MDTLRLVILGATGSIGTQALDVVPHGHADRIEVVALAGRPTCGRGRGPSHASLAASIWPLAMKAWP